MIVNWSFVKLFAFFFVLSPLFLKLTPAFIHQFHLLFSYNNCSHFCILFCFFKHMPPYLADSTCFLVTISHLLPSLSYFHLPFEIYATFPRHYTQFLELTTFYWMWRHFTHYVMAIITEPFEAHELFMNSHTVSHYHRSSSLLTPHKCIII